jgi:hypothetical protein
MDPARSSEKEEESERKKVSKDGEQSLLENKPSSEKTHLFAGMVDVLYLFT